MERNQQTDSDRAAFHRYYTREEWGASADYDLCLDTAALGLDNCVALIEEYLYLRYGVERPGKNETALS